MCSLYEYVEAIRVPHQPRLPQKFQSFTTHVSMIISPSQCFSEQSHQRNLLFFNLCLTSEILADREDEGLLITLISSFSLVEVCVNQSYQPLQKKTCSSPP